jgi:hypothetical protein
MTLLHLLSLAHPYARQQQKKKNKEKKKKRRERRRLLGHYSPGFIFSTVPRGNLNKHDFLLDF